MRIRTYRPPTTVRRWGALIAALALCAGPALADAPAIAGTVDDGIMATELATWEHAANAALSARAEALAAGGDADDKFAAALLYPFESAFDARAAGRSAGLRPAHVHQWLLDAVADPVDPSLPALWLVAGNCPLFEPARCDPEGALERLVQLDPGNGAVWLLKAQRADERGELADRGRWFARAADAPRIDFYDRELGRLLLHAGAGVELPPMGAQAAGAQRQLAGSDFSPTAAGWLDASLFGRWMAWAIPGLQWASSQCRTGAAAFDSGQLDRCQRLHARMAEQATVTVTQLYALAKAIQLQPELPALREAYRQALWQHAQAAEVLTPYGKPPPADYLRRVLADGELATWATLLEAAGVARVAPADWLPDVPQQRELILTGKRSN